MSRKALLLVALSFILSSTARAEVPANLLEQVRELTLRCVVQPVSFDRTGRKIYGRPRSVCVELQAQGARAQLWVGRLGLQAVLTRSAHADGNDLNNLYLYAGGRPVAQLLDVAAFGNILTALSGGTTEFREIR